MAEKVIVNFVKTNADVVRFLKDYKPVIFKACKETGLRRCDWESVLNDMATKYAEGRIMYDPTRGVKNSTYVYAIARNCAIEEFRRQHSERFEDMDDRDWEKIGDECHEFSQITANDKKMIGIEAMRRLTKQIHDKVKLELLVRFVINGENREKLAREYGVSNDYVSLQKTRYLSRLQELVQEAWMEDEDGKLKFSNNDISCLLPYINM